MERPRRRDRNPRSRLDEDIIARSRAHASYANYNPTVCQPSLTNVGGRPQEIL